MIKISCSTQSAVRGAGDASLGNVAWDGEGLDGLMAGP